MHTLDECKQWRGRSRWRAELSAKLFKGRYVDAVRYLETLKANLILCPINSDIPPFLPTQFLLLLANGRVNESVLKSTQWPIRGDDNSPLPHPLVVLYPPFDQVSSTFSGINILDFAYYVVKSATKTHN